MKKIVSLVLAISMVMSMFVSAFAASAFEDIEDPKCAAAVDALVELEVIDGLPDGTYGPTKEVTRAQLAKMLVICLGLGDSVESLASKVMFNDVDGHWAIGYINAAAQSKVIAGYPDGSFRPDESVSYEEAVTMVIRALGYGNVVETEGTWPTAYMLKAVELELFTDVEYAKSNDAATRGNVAILLWNMLRTQMWKIMEESEGNGMTSYASSLMLNVKFPDYKYVEEAYIDDIKVSDQDVTVELSTGDVAAVLDEDLPRLLEGMKVSALIEDYKDAEDALFLTLTPANTVVEGVVTKVTATRITIEDTEYRLENANQLFAIDEYVVAEVDGKGIETIVTLPNAAVEVEKIKTMEGQIDEDALIIIDGVWSTRDDLEVGDVYTEFADGVNGVDGRYYVATRERLEGTFESFTVENDDAEYAYVEVDGEEYRAFRAILNAYEGEDNDVLIDELDLREKEKDNKYLDNEVELVLNYLGQVVTIYFGEVSELDAVGNFYVVTSDGVWTESTSRGPVNHILLVGVDGEEEDYTFARGAEVPAELDEDANPSVYDNAETLEEATFVYVRFNDDGEIKAIEVIADGFTSGDYTVEGFAAEMSDDNYLANRTGSKVTGSTVVFRATPLVDDEDNVTGFEIEVTEGAEALNRVEEGMVAYDHTTTSKRAKFVFVSDDAKSNLNFGLVETTRERKGTYYATISGTEYKVDDPDDLLTYSGDVVPLVGKLVAFTENNGKITVEKEYANTDLDNAAIVTEVDDEFFTLDTAIPVSGDMANPVLDTTIDIKSEGATKLYEDYTFLRVSAYADSKDENKVVFEDDFEELGVGLENVKAKKGDRVSIDPINELVVIVTGFYADDVITDGKLDV